MPLSWVQALKAYNQEKGGCWCIPKKGSPEYQEVKRIQQRTSPEQTAQRNVERSAKALEQLRSLDTTAKITQRREAEKAKSKLVKVGMKSSREVIGEDERGREVYGYGVVYALGNEGKVPDRQNIAVEFEYEDGRSAGLRAAYKYTNENKSRLRYDVNYWLDEYKFTGKLKERLKYIVFPK